MVETDERGPWATEALDLVRAASGGMLFGIPLLYTMEVWWVGTTTRPLRVLTVLAMTFGVALILNRTSGFRPGSDVRWRDAAIDSVEAVAVGVVCVTVILVVLREVTSTTPVPEMLGKIAYEATPFGIGAGLAHTVLRRGRVKDADGGGDGGDGDGGDGEQDEAPTGLQASIADVGATLIGATIVAFNIAPTDEVPMLAAAMDPAWLVALIGVSLMVSYAIVFVAGFSNQEQRRDQPGIIQHPLTETLVAYLLALAAAAVMLWFFRRFQDGLPWDAQVAYIVVLGLPAAVGGAAGRLAV
jgi:putative integral membrane protein (TIGR02587 family)